MMTRTTKRNDLKSRRVSRILGLGEGTIQYSLQVLVQTSTMYCIQVQVLKKPGLSIFVQVL